LNHWKQVAEDAERELRVDVPAAQHQHEEIEAKLRHTIATLSEELPLKEKKLKDSKMEVPENVGSIHSVPAALHGLVMPPQRPLQASMAGRRRALVVGCNYWTSHAPLQGCTNDAWNVQCLLRQSLQYGQDQVKCLLDGSETCPSPAGQQPTQANIRDGLQWLVGYAQPGDNVLLFFCGYGTQQPQAQLDGLHESYLVPLDFAADLPSNFPWKREIDASTAAQLPRGCRYRLISLTEISNALMRLPRGCRATVVLDCCHSSVPNIAVANPAPQAFPRVMMESVDFVVSSTSVHGKLAPRPRVLELPPLPTPPVRATPGVPVACCHCYSACQNQQWNSELPIEGCVQGAFTWTFIKALTAGHLDSSVHSHVKAMHSILGDLRQHFRWLDQTPVLQLSSAARLQDPVLVS